MPVLGRTAPINTPNDVLTAWQWEFDGAYAAGRMFMLTMHPHTTGRFARLEALERLIRHMKSKPNTSFMRCIDVAEQWRGLWGP